MALQVGPYSLNLLETGQFALDGGAMFSIVPKILWQRNTAVDDQNRIDMALRILLIKSKDRTILVDTGIGTKWSDKYQKIYRIDHSKYTLETALKEQGVTCEDVTDVILTHLHFDHAGGSTYHDKDVIKLTFPNATYYVQKKQWEWANRPSEKDRASFVKENFLPIYEAGKLKTLEGPSELFPGIHIMISHGHTESQQVVKITDGKKTVFYCGDMIPTASHVPIPYIMSYDNLPLVMMEEKRHILEQAVKDNWILCFEHDPKIGAATVQKDPLKGRFSIKETVTF